MLLIINIFIAYLLICFYDQLTIDLNWIKKFMSLMTNEDLDAELYLNWYILLNVMRNMRQFENSCFTISNTLLFHYSTITTLLLLFYYSYDLFLYNILCTNYISVISICIFSYTLWNFAVSTILRCVIVSYSEDT